MANIALCDGRDGSCLDRLECQRFTAEKHKDRTYLLPIFVNNTCHDFVSIEMRAYDLRIKKLMQFEDQDPGDED